MIVAYHRPRNIEQTIALLESSEVKPVLIGGGSAIDRFTREPIAIIDLQDTGLNELRDRGNSLDIGSAVTLQKLSDHPAIQKSLLQAIHLEAALNIRQVATIAGTIIASDGRSPLTLAMFALNASLRLEPGEEQVNIGDLLPIKEKKLEGRLVTMITIPLNVRLAFDYVARTPKDQIIVSAAVAKWPAGRTRVALGGYGDSPILAFDGPQSGGEREAAESAYRDAVDQWASAEYRQEIASTLVKRCLTALSS